MRIRDAICRRRADRLGRLANGLAILAGALSLVPGGFAAVPPAERATNDFAFIDNGELRLGVKKSSGAGIAFLARSATGENLINHWDRGRLVQQSYYGAKDASL